MGTSDDHSFSRQSALTTSNGSRWLLWGGLLAAVLVAVLVALISIDVRTALTGALSVVALYIAMVVVRFAVRSQRARLVSLAILTAVMAATALTFVTLTGNVVGTGV